MPRSHEMLLPCDDEELTQSDPMLSDDGPPPEIVFLGGNDMRKDDMSIPLQPVIHRSAFKPKGNDL